MHVNKVDSNNFKGINPKQAGNIFFERINSPKRYEKYISLELAQKNNPYNINLSLGKNKSLKGVITDETGNIVYSKDENKLNAFFNLSPLRFLRDLCKQADQFNMKK